MAWSITDVPLSKILPLLSILPVDKTLPTEPVDEYEPLILKLSLSTLKTVVLPDVIVKADTFESNTGGDTISFGDNLSVTGHITASGNINTTAGRVFEQGTSVIDHATSMAIVFGG